MKAIPQYGSSLLSRKQKMLLVFLARKAWQEKGCPDTEPAWRHAQSVSACGLRISEAGQKHWAPLKAHFQDLAGMYAEAFETMMRAESNARRIALHKLEKECAAKKLPLSYPAAICQRQYRSTLAEATPRQLWTLIYTVRNRRKTQ